MNDDEAYEFYADPANREITGPGRKRTGQRLASMTAVRFAPEVIEAVKDRAFSEGVTVGHWIRRLVNREIAEPRTFSCPHLSVSNVTHAACGICGPLTAVAA